MGYIHEKMYCFLVFSQICNWLWFWNDCVGRGFIIYLRGRDMEPETGRENATASERGRPSSIQSSNGNNSHDWAQPKQSLELVYGLPHGWQGSHNWVLFGCLPTLAGVWIGSWAARTPTSNCAPMGGHSRWLLTLLLLHWSLYSAACS